MAGSTSAVVVVGAALTLLVCPTVADPSRRLNPMRPKAFDFAAEAESVVGELNDNFSCDSRPYGYYADQSHKCQVFHICMPVTTATGRTLDTFQFSFFCPNQTRFSQDSRTCIDEERAFPCHKAHTLYDLNKNIGKRPAKKKRPVDPKTAVVGAHKFSSSVSSATEETKSSFDPPEELGNIGTSFSSQVSSRDHGHEDSGLIIGAVVIPTSRSTSSSRSSDGSSSSPTSQRSSSSQFSLSAKSSDQSSHRAVGSTRAEVSKFKPGQSEHEHVSSSRGGSQHTTRTSSTEPILPPGAQIFSTVSIHSQNALPGSGHTQDDTTGNVGTSATTRTPFFSSSSHSSSTFSSSRTLTTPEPTQFFTTSSYPTLRSSNDSTVNNLRPSSLTGSIPFSSGLAANSIQEASIGFTQPTPINAHALITAAHTANFGSEQSEGRLNNQGSLITRVASGSAAENFAQTDGRAQGLSVSSRGRTQSSTSGSVNFDSSHISAGSIKQGSSAFSLVSSGSLDASKEAVTPQPAIFIGQSVAPTRNPSFTHQPASSTRQPASPTHQPAISTHQRAFSTHQQVSPTVQPASPAHQPASTHQHLTPRPTGAQQPTSSSPRLQIPGFSADVISAGGREAHASGFSPSVHLHATSGVTIPSTTQYYDDEDSYDAFVTTEVAFEAERDFNDAQFSGSRDGFNSPFPRGSAFSGGSVVTTTSSTGLSGFSASQNVHDSSDLTGSSRSSSLHGSGISSSARGSVSLQGSDAFVNDHGSASFQGSGLATGVHGSTHFRGSGAASGTHGSTHFQGSGAATGVRGSTNFLGSGASVSGHGSVDFRGSEIHGSTNFRGSDSSSGVHRSTNNQGSGALSGVRGSIDFQGSDFSHSSLGSNFPKSSTSLGQRSQSSHGFGVSSSALSHSQEFNSVSGFSDESHKFDSSAFNNGGLSTSSRRGASRTVGSSRGTSTDVRGSLGSGNDNGLTTPLAIRGSVTPSGFRGSMQHTVEEALPGGSSLAFSMDRGPVNAFTAAAAAEEATARAAAAAMAAANRGSLVSSNTKSNFTITRNRGKKKFQPSLYLIQSSDWSFQASKDVSSNIQRGTQRHVNTRGGSGVSRAVSTNSVNRGASPVNQKSSGPASQAEDSVDTSSKFETNTVSSFSPSVQNFQNLPEASGQKISSSRVPALSDTHALNGSSKVRGSASFSDTQRSSPSSRIRGSSLASTASQTSSGFSKVQGSSNVQGSSTMLHGSNASSRVHGSLGSINTQQSNTEERAQENLRSNDFGANSINSFSRNRLTNRIKEPIQSEDYYTTTEFESEFTTESSFVEDNENFDTIPTTYRPDISVSFDSNQAVSSSKSRELTSRGSSGSFASNSLSSVQNSRRRGPGRVTPLPAVSSPVPLTPEESPYASAATNIQVSEHTLQHHINTSPSRTRITPTATTTAVPVHVGVSTQVASRRRGTTSRGTQSRKQLSTQSSSLPESPESDAHGSDTAAEHTEAGQTSSARKVIKKKIVINGRPGSRGSQEQSITEPSIVANESQDEEAKKHRLALEALAKFNPALANARILSVKFTKNVKSNSGKSTTDNITKETVGATSSIGSSRSFGNQRGNSGRINDIVTTTPATTTQSARVRSPKRLRPITVQQNTATVTTTTPPTTETPSPVTTTQSARERSSRRFRPLTVRDTTVITTTTTEVPTSLTTTQSLRVRSPRRFRPLTVEQTTASATTEAATLITTTQSSRVSSRERVRQLRSQQTSATATTEAPIPVTTIPTPSQRNRNSGRRTTTRKESFSQVQNGEATTVIPTPVSRSTDSSSKQLQSQTRRNDRIGNTSSNRRKILKKVTPISHGSSSLKVVKVDSASSSAAAISRSSTASASSSSDSALSSSSSTTEKNVSGSLKSTGNPPDQSLRVVATSIKSSGSQVSINDNPAVPSTFSLSPNDSGNSRSNERRDSRPNTRGTSRKTLNNAEKGIARPTHNPLTDSELEALSALANVSTSLGSSVHKSAGILPNILPEAEVESKTRRINSRRTRLQTSRGRSRTPHNL
ncbi:pneumococcal serine-rich repeat protein [Procambarus clarkii]|uniref:pneumococcal serine-rich repeat protein n=1 Tax=Procambarus clarkii TaxID=6728 RepID=UPI0037434355